MNIFKNISLPSLFSGSTPQKAVNNLFRDIRMEGLGQLPSNYASVIDEYFLLTEHPHQFIRELVRRTNQILQSAGLSQASQKMQSQKQEQINFKRLIKIICVILKLAQKRNYAYEDIEPLTQLEAGQVFEEKDLKPEKSKPKKSMTQRISYEPEQQEKYQASQIWIANLINSFIQYIIKIPSMTDIYQQCQDNFSNHGRLQKHTPQNIQLTHLFRIMNQSQIILKWLHHAVNVVGRYHFIKYPEFGQLYRIISYELSCFHYYMKYLIDSMFENYRVYEITHLECFVKVLPELQLASDRMEDLLVNKYFKGTRIMSKLEIKQEKVAEVMYYLEYQYNGDRTQMTIKQKFLGNRKEHKTYF